MEVVLDDLVEARGEQERVQVVLVVVARELLRELPGEEHRQGSEVQQQVVDAQLADPDRRLLRSRGARARRCRRRQPGVLGRFDPPVPDRTRDHQIVGCGDLDAGPMTADIRTPPSSPWSVGKPRRRPSQSGGERAPSLHRRVPARGDA